MTNTLIIFLLFLIGIDVILVLYLKIINKFEKYVSFIELLRVLRFIDGKLIQVEMSKTIQQKKSVSKIHAEKSKNLLEFEE